MNFQLVFLCLGLCVAFVKGIVFVTFLLVYQCYIFGGVALKPPM